MKRTVACALLLAVAVLPLLQGCVPLVAAGATTGALAAIDRRTLGTQTEDETIEWKALTRTNEKIGDRAHVNFTSYNRKLLITGEAASEAVRSEIERIAGSVPQVLGVYNELSIGPPTSLILRSDDSYITTRVKARYVDQGRFSSVHVKVVTETGVVYLMGLVTQREADSAIQIARTTPGVKKVVTLMEILADGKARELDLRPAPARETPLPGSVGG